jgi:hypothetical protein
MSDHKIKPKRTTTSGAAGVPTTSNLEAGEIAINLADKKLFVRDTSSNILELTTRTIDSLDNTTISSPATGEVLTYNAGSSKWENSGSTAAVWETTEHIATAGQTAFSADYTVGSLDVFLNGIRLDATDYTASSGTLVTLDTGAAVGDTVYISSYSISAGGLPSQSGNTGKYLTTDGTTATWASVAADTNNYVDSLAFSTSTGVLTVGRSGSLGDLTVDLDGKYAESGHTHDSVKIRDARADGDKTPNDYPGQQATFEFSDDLVGGPGSWESAITMKGWSDNYRVWQLRADSTTGTGDQNLWFRTGSGTSWETTDKLWTSGNLTPLAIGTTSTTALAGDTSYSTLAIGTTSTTALAGDTSLLAIGASSTDAAAGNHNHDSDYLELIPNTIAMGSDYSTGYTNSRITMIASQSNSRGAGVFVHNTASDYEWFYGMPYSANGNAFAICSKYTTAHDDATADKANAEFIIDQNGNVGIGTTSPSSILDVDSGASGTAAYLKIGNAATTGYIGVAGDNNVYLGSYTSDQVRFAIGTSTKMTLSTAGNLGIGTTNPYNKLHVYGTARLGNTMVGDSAASNVPSAPLHIKSSGVNAKMRIEDSDSSNLAFDFLVNHGSGFSIIETIGGDAGDDTRLHIAETTGNVGIGTSSPARNLVVKGSTPHLSILASSTTDICYLNFGDTDDDNVGRIAYSNNTNSMGLYTNASERMHIDSSGNVGIGTSSPTTKLDVAGTVRASTITSTGNTNIGGELNLTASGNNYVDFVDTLRVRAYGSSPAYEASITAFKDGAVDLAHNGVKRLATTSTGISVTGNITATGTITAYYSDERLKTNLGNISSPLDKVLKLNGFNYIENKLANSFGYDSTSIQVGVSAQDVQKVLPAAVSIAPFDRGEKGLSKSGEDYLTVDYAKMVPLLIEAIKELKEEVDSLKGARDE